MVATRCSSRGKDWTREKVVPLRQQCSPEIGTWRGGGKCILGDFQELAGESRSWCGLVLVTVLQEAGLETCRKLPQPVLSFSDLLSFYKILRVKHCEDKLYAETK